MIHPNKLDHPGFRHIFYTSPNKKKHKKSQFWVQLKVPREPMLEDFI